MLELWEHQQVAVKRAETATNLALFFETGTGKTRTIIEILRADFTKEQRISPTLIFAPLTICKQWKAEFEKYSKIPQDKILVLTQGGPKRTKLLAHEISQRRDFIVITNYEALRIKDFKSLLSQWCPEILVCDEAHALKDSNSKRSKDMYPLAFKARRRFLMTGTPVPNSMLDIFGQFKILDENIFEGTFYNFQTKYFYNKNLNMPKHCYFPDWQPKPSSAAGIGKKISEHSVQAKKSECLDLPPLLKVTIPVEMSPKQLSMYKSMEDNFVAELDGDVTVAEFAMTKTLRLQQIVAGYIAPEGSDNPIWVDDVPKLAALDTLLESVGREKVIIWTAFRATYARIAKVCKDRGMEYVHLNGDQNIKEKEEAIAEFKTGKAQVMVANPAAGGAGVDLFEAAYAIYYSKGYNAVHYEQSEGRNYRGGSERYDKITHYHLVSPGTIDEVISDALLFKRNVQEEVLKWAKSLDSSKYPIDGVPKKEAPHACKHPSVK